VFVTVEIAEGFFHLNVRCISPVVSSAIRAAVHSFVWCRIFSPMHFVLHTLMMIIVFISVAAGRDVILRY